MFFSTFSSHAQTSSDTTVVNEPYKSSRYPTYEPTDRPGDPFYHRESGSSLFLKNSSAFKVGLNIDTSMTYTIYEDFGGLNYRPPTKMSFNDFDRLNTQRIMKEYWQQRSAGIDGESAVSGRRLIAPIYMSPAFDRIFGGSYVDIRPSGYINLDFGGQWQRVQNPALSIRQQRTGGFEFDQQISMNVIGKIGEKLTVSANFDNNNSFDFQNDLKVDFTGFEEDIIQKIEIGNVSLPLNNSLITGAQNLFGVKTQLRFGHVYVTAVASTQRGKSESIEINTGSTGGQGREFEFPASNYDENKHFFLGHFFRDNYEQWLRGIPNVLSGVQITRVEVYVSNRVNDTESQRTFAGFMDLGEGKVVFQPDNPQISPVKGDVPNDNAANRLFNNLVNEPGLREVGNINTILENSATYNFTNGTDYQTITSARKLEPKEYTINPLLGTISLQRRLQNDEVLGVAYEYSYNGQIYKVGELTEDYQNLPENATVFLKMLRPGKINPNVPTWDLMMKNVYSLNASQVEQTGFEMRIIYRDDVTGIDNPSLHEGKRTKDVPLIELSGLDRLNMNNDPQKDGNFDFVPGVTIIPETGLIFFPVLEPFGSNLESFFDPASEQGLIQKYVFDSLYRTTKADAELITSFNKFFMKGLMQSGSSSEIQLPGINIQEGSVVVYAGNTPLQENTQYRVDYMLGKVTILDESVLNSGKTIRITFEKADLFNFQRRSLVGTRVEYLGNEKFTAGGTFLYLNERPLISRSSVGDEPIRNMKYGLDFSFRDDSRLLTKMVDALPFVQTKEKSTVTFNAEFAQLIPGTSNRIDGEGTAYLEDFESSATPFGLGNNILNWRHASTPRTDNGRFDDGVTESNNVAINNRRAKLAWYIIDNLFYTNLGGLRPANITNTDLENHYVRPIAPQEVFRNLDQTVLNANLPTFDLAFYPTERGPYNYNTDLTNDGQLKEPERNWGGITRAITSDVDFDKNNIEYIQFWLLDPMLPGDNGVVLDGSNNPTNNTTGGKLIFHLGSVSEDLMWDNRHAFENGLPPDGDPTKVDTTNWGWVTKQQFLTNSFDNSAAARPNQDVGLDGIPSNTEQSFFRNYLDDLNISAEAREAIQADPSGDDFRYYLNGFYDDIDAKVLERYKLFNNMENNSPISAGNQQIVQSGTNLPDNEDMNNDNTLSDLEEYYEYEIDINNNSLTIDNPLIVDVVPATLQNGEQVSWYQFRIPIRKPDRTQGNISGFKSIRFVRTILTAFRQPVVMRLVDFQLVGSQWRLFRENLYERGLYERPEIKDTEVVTSVVNIEENGAQNETIGKIPYVTPPGVRRDLDNTSPIVRRVNEQSLQVCIKDLEDKDARAVYKNVNFNLNYYGRLKMFFHGQRNNNIPVNDDELTAFLRLGTDLDENYYEIEIPLKITPPGTTVGEPDIIWPEDNQIDISISALSEIKSRRDREIENINIPFTFQLDERHKVTVKGRPDLSTVLNLMIGVRNPSSSGDESPKSICIWANELRVTEFDRTKGWATNAYMNMKMADFANVNASVRYNTIGFGGVQQRISERALEQNLNYDISGTVNLDKFLFDRIGIKIPMYVSYEKQEIIPKFDPLDPDVTLDAKLNSFEDDADRKDYRNKVIDQSEKRSLNFTNVRKVKMKPDAKNHFYDIENLSFTYAYSDAKRTNHNIASYDFTSHKGSVAYNYNAAAGEVEPFKNAKGLKSPYLQLIKDINFMFWPSNLSLRWDVDRRFTRTQLYNEQLSTEGVLPTWQKTFTFNRFYSFRWNLSKGLSLDYSARANALVDEPDGDIDTRPKRDFILDNLKRLGRMKNFNQTVALNYRVPLDKFPITNWIGLDTRYSAGYSWTAGAYSPIDSLNLQLLFGNIIQNNQDIGFNGKLDFVKLYNNSKYLKEINRPPRRSRRSGTSRTQTAEADTVKTPFGKTKFMKGLVRFLMMLRSVNFTYNQRASTALPGFANSPWLFGMDSSWNSPGWDFILGSQDPNIRQRAAEKGWIVQDTIVPTPFTQMRGYDINLKANLEPTSDFRIQLDASISATGSYEERFIVPIPGSDRDTTGFAYNKLNPSRNGAYNISYNIIRTAFQGIDGENRNQAYRNFEAYRSIIRDRLGQEFALNSQDVLIPAMLAAYSKKDPNTIDLSPFPTIPIPGWRVDYSGLSKIPSIRKTFSSFNITHAYRSSYTITNYTNSLQYADNLELDQSLTFYPFPTAINENGERIPVYLMNTITLTEEFSPLIGINFRTKSKFTGRIEYRNKRSLSLNVSNAQITEVRNNDVSVDIGYTKAGMKMPFKSRGETITLKNDITFKFNFTVRDAVTIQHKTEPEGADEASVSTITNGNTNYQFRPQISYVLNQRLNLNIYFERTINAPRISTSFRRSTTAAGVQVRFSLAQ